jgi:hypothetical protein
LNSRGNETERQILFAKLAEMHSHTFRFVIKKNYGKQIVLDPATGMELKG